jgi:transcriptional regulator GlxA family with amidase domain
VLSRQVVEAKLAEQSPSVDFEELAHGMASAVLQVLGKTNYEKGVATAADERRVSATVRFIQANLGEPLPLDKLALTAKMSEFHFLRMFKQVMRVTPHQFILRSRLREAALQLKTTRDEVLQIALNTGFGDLSNFNHAFRSEFGMSPTRYARRP